jgi:hypothetical protein
MLGGDLKWRWLETEERNVFVGGGGAEVDV